MRLFVATIVGFFVFTAGQGYAETATTIPDIGAFFNTANKANMKEKVEEFYDPEVKFVDPIVNLQGRDALLQHYLNLYENVTEIRFEMGDTVVTGNQVAASWVMYMKHPKIKSGEEIAVEGMSHLKLNGSKVLYHHDYFDLGAMVYEHVSFVGYLVRSVKDRLKQPH